MNYGNKIAELRKNKGLTQAELGGMLNITAQAISKWENDLSEPDINSIKNMCEIFEITVDEFLGISNSKSKENSDTETSNIIVGTCEKCDKPVSYNDCKYLSYRYVPNSKLYKVVPCDYNNIFCSACYDEMMEIKKYEQYARIEQENKDKKSRKKRKTKNNAITGSIFIGIISLIIVALYFILPDWKTFSVSVIYGAGVIAFICLLLWKTFIVDLFEFFCRTFHSPFGLIFELSLDGILWFITVKLALWIICVIFSIIWFLIGLIVCPLVSLACFPFVVAVKIIKSYKNLTK